jgi:hypothetical protein
MSLRNVKKIDLNTEAELEKCFCHLCCKSHVVPAEVADLEQDVAPLELRKLKLFPALLLLPHSGQLTL